MGEDEMIVERCRIRAFSKLCDVFEVTREEHDAICRNYLRHQTEFDPGQSFPLPKTFMGMEMRLVSPISQKESK